MARDLGNSSYRSNELSEPLTAYADRMHFAAAASQRESKSVELDPDNAKGAPGPTAPTPRWFRKTLKMAAFSGLEKIINAKVRNQEIPVQAVEIMTALSCCGSQGRVSSPGIRPGLGWLLGFE